MEGDLQLSPENSDADERNEEDILGNATVKVFRIIPKFRNLRLTFHRNLAWKY